MLISGLSEQDLILPDLLSLNIINVWPSFEKANKELILSSVFIILNKIEGKVTLELMDIFNTDAWHK